MRAFRGITPETFGADVAIAILKLNVSVRDVRVLYGLRTAYFPLKFDLLQCTHSLRILMGLWTYRLWRLRLIRFENFGEAFDAHGRQRSDFSFEVIAMPVALVVRLHQVEIGELHSTSRTRKHGRHLQNSNTYLAAARLNTVMVMSKK